MLSNSVVFASVILLIVESGLPESHYHIIPLIFAMLFYVTGLSVYLAGALDFCWVMTMESLVV